jgi:DNA-binding CsgD family transcriptional regulator
MFLGFGFHLLWLAEVIFQFYPSNYMSDATVAQLYREIGIVSVAIAIVVMLCMGWLIDRITYYIRLHRLQIVIASLMALSSFILLMTQFFVSVPLVILGNALAGATSGFVTLIWAEAFRRRETPSIVLNSMLACCTCLLGFAFLGAFVPPIWIGTILCILPLFSLVGMFVIMHGRKAFFRNQEFVVDNDGVKKPIHGIREVPTFRKLRVSKRQMLAKIGLPSAFLGIGLGVVVYYMSASQTTIHLDTGNFIIEAVLGCILALTVAGLLTAINHDRIYGRFYRFAVPVVPVAIFAAMFMRENFMQDNQAYIAFLYLSFALYAFLVWVELSELSHQYRISPILVHGFALTFFVAACMLSQSLMTLIVIPSDICGSLAIACGITLLFCVGYFLLPTEKDIRKIAIIDADADDQKTSNANGEHTTDEGADGEEGARRTRFVVRCEQVANTYLLTARETDLLYLLAKGRNASHIAKQLYISEGTVHTHTWHIYRKLNVHTQQELIDLVDSHDLSANNSN